jgi:WRKY DNA -binding domain
MPDHDGYMWRKYGQKNILNQRYSRSYYRCTYHLDRSCMATKQVQQCNDEYPPLFEVTYFDEHTCNIDTSKTKSKIKQNVFDFSGKSVPESNFSTNAMVCRRKKEEAILLSCLIHVVKGISENLPNAANDSAVSNDEDISSIQTILLREDELPVVDAATMDLEWLEQDHIQSLLELLPPI